MAAKDTKTLKDDIERLREWSRLIHVHGHDISEWGAAPFVAGELERIAARLVLLAAPSGEPPTMDDLDAYIAYTDGGASTQPSSPAPDVDAGMVAHRQALEAYGSACYSRAEDSRIHDLKIDTLLAVDRVGRAAVAHGRALAVHDGRCPTCGLEDRRYYVTRLDELVKIQATVTEQAKEIETLRADPPVCEHCGLPMVCASGQAELVHGIAQMHAEALTRAEAAEAEVTRLIFDVAEEGALRMDVEAKLDRAMAEVTRLKTDSDELVAAVLKNFGVDTDCGACMEIGYTGVTTNQHTCKREVESSLLAQREQAP